MAAWQLNDASLEVNARRLMVQCALVALIVFRRFAVVRHQCVAPQLVSPTLALHVLVVRHARRHVRVRLVALRQLVQQ